jgi:hypothetical protein
LATRPPWRPTAEVHATQTLMRGRGIELGVAVGVNAEEVFVSPAAGQEQYPAGDTFCVDAE